MNRNEWIDLNFIITHDMLPESVRNVEKIYEEFLRTEIDRGWKTGSVEKVSQHILLHDLKHEHDLDVDFSPTIVKWCEENCEGKWAGINLVWWEFELETDAMAFKLMWT